MTYETGIAGFSCTTRIRLAMALREILWGRVDNAVGASPQGRKGVQTALESMQKPKNKNTYTRWLSPKFANARPDIRISELEDLAAALNVPAASLLTSNGVPPTPAVQQLELPFGSGPHKVTVKMECTTKSLILRPADD
jgi:hypothetical protein